MKKLIIIIFSFFLFFSCSFKTDKKIDSTEIKDDTNLYTNDFDEVSETDLDADINKDDDNDNSFSDRDEETTNYNDDDEIIDTNEESISDDENIVQDEVVLDEGNADDDGIIFDEDFSDYDNQPDNEIPSELKIRIMAANTTSGKNQAYETPGINIFKAFDADIILIQEFNYKSGTIDQFVDSVFGTEFSYYRGIGNIPNGIISRYPILDDGYWDDPYISDRNLDYAIIDIPGNRDIFAISVHLHTSPASDQVGAAKIIAGKVADLKKQHPGKYYFVVGGDFNGPSSVDDAGFGAYDSFYIEGPHPVSENGIFGTNSSREKVYDWILTDSELNKFMIPVVCGDFSYNNGLVFDSREYSQSELDKNFYPVKTGDSGALNMQHMAIIKDFLITIF